MSLVNQITSDRNRARVGGDSVIFNLLGVLLGAISTKERAGKEKRELQDSEIVAEVKKLIDNINETISVLNGRDDRVDDLHKAENERACLMAYMPAQLSETELESLIRAEKDSGKNLGQIMASLKASHAGKYDGKLASEIAKRVIQP